MGKRRNRMKRSKKEMKWRIEKRMGKMVKGKKMKRKVRMKK